MGYGLGETANRFQRAGFPYARNPNAALLDFFTYNPVDHNYPRLGVANLNTKNVPVIAAILQNAIKKDVDVSPTPNPYPTVAPSEATAAAQAIVNATICPASAESRGHRPAYRRGCERNLHRRLRRGRRNRKGPGSDHTCPLRGRTNADLEPDDRCDRADGKI